MYVSKRSMGPVPCIALRDLWDRSHVWLSETHGTGPIAQLGLHIITSTLCHVICYYVPLMSYCWRLWHLCHMKQICTIKWPNKLVISECILLFYWALSSWSTPSSTWVINNLSNISLDQCILQTNTLVPATGLTSSEGMDSNQGASTNKYLGVEGMNFRYNL